MKKIFSGFILFLISIQVFAVGSLNFNPVLRSVTSLPGGAEIFGPGLTTDQINLNFSGIATVANSANLKMITTSDYGAIGDGITNDTNAFSAAANSGHNEIHVPSGSYLLSTQPSSPGNITWVIHTGATFTNITPWGVNDNVVSFGHHSKSWLDGLHGGILSYLHDASAVNVLPQFAMIGYSSAVHTTQGITNPNQAPISYAWAAINDNATTTPTQYPGVWGVYGTTIRETGVHGFTQGAELDIANLGSTVPVYPYHMIQDGMTVNMSLATGGEVTANSIVGSASAALTINQNDATNNATYDKGIVISSASLKAAGGISTAIALANGQSINWYNSSDTVTAYLRSTATSADTVGIDMQDTGLSFISTATNIPIGFINSAGTLGINEINVEAALITVSSCGTGSSGTAGSSNNAGQFTFGSGNPTSCSIGFSIPYANTAFCVVTPASPYTGTYYISNSSKTGFTLTLGAGTSSAVFNYSCLGN